VESLTVEAIVAAFNNRKSADLYFGRGTTKTGSNRRAAEPDTDSQDELVDVLHARTSDGLLATVFRASIYPVWVAASTISADFCGVARKEHEKTHGTALFVQGWAGNCDPKYLACYFGAADSMDKMVKYGEALAKDVMTVLAPIGAEALSGRTQLQGKVAGRSPTIFHPFQSGRPAFPQEVQALIIGSPRTDWHFVGCSHEVTTDQAPRAQVALPFDHVTLAGYNAILWQRDATQANLPWTNIGHAEPVVGLATARDRLICAMGGSLWWRNLADSDQPWKRFAAADLVALCSLGDQLYCTTANGVLWTRSV
jgi:hypothetical protein